MWLCCSCLQEDTLVTRENLSLFPHPWAWSGLETCFDRQNAAKMMLCDFQNQTLRSLVASSFAVLDHSLLPSCQETQCRILVEESWDDLPDSQHQLSGFWLRPSERFTPFKPQMRAATWVTLGEISRRTSQLIPAQIAELWAVDTWAQNYPIINGRARMWT